MKGRCDRTFWYSLIRSFRFRSWVYLFQYIRSFTPTLSLRVISFQNLLGNVVWIPYRQVWPLLISRDFPSRNPFCIQLLYLLYYPICYLGNFSSYLVIRPLLYPLIIEFLFVFRCFLSLTLVSYDELRRCLLQIFQNYYIWDWRLNFIFYH